MWIFLFFFFSTESQSRDSLQQFKLHSYLIGYYCLFLKYILEKVLNVFTWFIGGGDCTNMKFEINCENLKNF